MEMSGQDELEGSARPEDVPRRPPPWLPLLRRLTELSPAWGVWKNADRAIAGYGDIDSISSPSRS